MKDKFNFVKKHKKYFYFGVPILLIALYFLIGPKEKGTEEYLVESTNVTQSVLLSGKVETTDKADLGFAASGRVSRISVKNNQKVGQGQILAQLEIGDLLADLKIKQLGSQTSGVDLEDAKKEVEKVTKQENTKVASAYRKLLTEGLELIPDSSNYNLVPPTISGIYDGAEGQYKILFNRENADHTQMLTFGLERTIDIVKNQGSTALGTRGLYISFPNDEPSLYRDTTWFLDIPNKVSPSYLSNYNDYNEAKDAKDLAIKNAEFEYQKLLTSDDGGSSVAQAEIQKINAEIRKNTIYAPFSGVVTNIEKEVGENAGVGEQVISILGENKLEVVMQVSELDVSKLVPDSQIQISIDAFPGEIFTGTLKTVNLRDTKVDGVPVYEAFVELAADPRVKTGMNAKGTVILATKSNVIAVPSYLIEKSADGNTVEVITKDGKTEKRNITLGLMGTDSMVEITSGLNAGDKILAKAAK